MRMEITIRLFVVTILASVVCAPVNAQTATPSPAPKATWQRKMPTPLPRVKVTPVFVQNNDLAPQVVTILHGLDGVKLFRLLARSNELAAISQLDQAFQINNEIHTNVIAGLALDDGKTIAVWLPEAEAEMPPASFTFAPGALAAPYGLSPTAPPAAPATKTPPAPAGIPQPPSPGATAVAGFPHVPFPSEMFAPDLKVVTREGKRLEAKYLGLDGLSGLSVITLADHSLPELDEIKKEIINVGQRLRLIGPEPATPTPGSRRGVYVRLGETEAHVLSVNRSSAGGVRRVKIRSARLTPANMGGIAINDAGETLGIVDTVKGNEATIVPLSLIRSAVKRVVDRQASVPRPWLGISGEPIGAVSFERIKRVGWEAKRAQALADKRQGIMLTSVIPGSPAALAQLRPGDVILSVNNDEVQSAEDFTWLLDGAGPGNSVKFTVARPEKAASEAMEIELCESPDPLFGRRKRDGRSTRAVIPGSLLARGIETIALKPRAAVHFGATGGLLVVSVGPTTPAFKAGLQPGDVIEAINGEAVVSRPVPATLLSGAGGEAIFNVVRNRKKMVITIKLK